MEAVRLTIRPQVATTLPWLISSLNRSTAAGFVLLVRRKLLQKAPETNMKSSVVSLKP
jgi:hypothetical protein